MVNSMSSVLTITSSVADASSFGATDGTISIVPTGGTAPYSYLWSNGATTASITAAAGVYTLTVHDANGLTLTQSFSIAQPLVFNVDATLPDTGLLSDTLCRDLHGRAIYVNAETIVGRGAAEATHSLFTSTTSYKTGSTFRTVFEPDGNCGQFLSPYDTAGVAHDVVHITIDGVEINGNLVINGSTTKVEVNQIVVDDKLIVLQQNASTASALDGTGIQFGQSQLNRTLLYSSASDALVWSGNLNATSLNSGPNFLTPSTFTAGSAAGSIVLDDFGLTITNAKLVNAIPTSAQIMSDRGILVRATGQTFGYVGTTSSWNTSGDPIEAGGFSIPNGGPSLTSSMLSYATATSAQNTFGSTGLVVGNTVSISTDGIDIQDNNACCYFGNRAWRISYDPVENALNFDKQQPDGSFLNKLTLD